MLAAATALRCVLFILVLAIGSTAVAVQPQPSCKPSDDTMLSAQECMDYLVDPAGKLNVNAIAGSRSDEWHPVKNMPYAGYTRKIYWVRLRVNLSDYRNTELFFLKDYENIGAITVFFPDANGIGFSSTTIDENEYLHGRQYRSRDYIFRTPTPDSRTATYYVRFDPRGHLLHVNLLLGNEVALINHIQSDQGWIGLFFGALLIMLIYNGVLYLYTRNNAYLFYCYYLSCFIAIFVNLNGFSSLVFHIPPAMEAVFVLCVYGTLHGITLFARYFLNLEPSLSKVDAYLKHIKWPLMAGAVSACFFPVGLAYRTSVFFILAVIPAVLYAGIQRWRQGFAPAKQFCLGWAVFALAIVTYSLKLLGVLSIDVVNDYVVQAGAVWEAFFFSLALGYRIKVADAAAVKQREIALQAERKAIDIAQNLAREKSTFLGMISHELKSPLQVILSALDMLELRPSDNQNEFVRRIRRASNALSIQLRDLLTFAQGEAGKLEIFPEPFEAKELVSDVIDLHSEEASQKRLGVKLTLPSEPVYLVADPTRISQVLSNLVGNAIKYTAHGQISVTLHPYDAKAGTVCFEVQDTGQGIPEAFLPRLFKPYNRFATLDRSRESSGIGLAIVRMIVDHLGGEIMVESEEGVGTSFRVLIPAADADAQDSPHAAGRRHVLIVDDREDVLDSLESVVLGLGHTCAKARSAAVAANLLAARRYDLVLVDLDMPIKNGFELASETRRGGGPNKDSRLVAFSASATNAEGKSWPFDSFLQKPVTRDTLKWIIDSFSCRQEK